MCLSPKPKQSQNVFSSRFLRWTAERYPLGRLIQTLENKSVPMGVSRYYLGGAALLLFLVQIVSGLLLMVYFVPTVEGSRESLVFIADKVTFGPLVRSVHVWSSHLMIVFLLGHFWTSYFSCSYRRPREATWISGMVILGLLMGLCFTGHVLPWDEKALSVASVGTSLLEQLPFVGKRLGALVRGGSHLGEATLLRSYVLHVCILPGVLLGLLFLHLVFVHIQGVSFGFRWAKIPEEQRPSMSFMYSYLPRMLLLWILLLNIVLALAWFFPLDVNLDAVLDTSVSKDMRPPWYFLFLYKTLEVLPAQVFGIQSASFGIALLGLLGAILLIVPFWDRASESQGRKPAAVFVGVVVLGYWIAMTIWGLL